MKKRRFTIIGDIHLGKLVECRPGEEAEKLIRDFLDLNEPSDIIELGDRINNTSHDIDLKNTEKIVSLFKNEKRQVYPLLGNHDLHSLSTEENEKTLNIKSSYYSHIIDGFHFVFLNTADPVMKDCMGNVSEKQMDWLKTELQSSDLPKIVCGHHPFYAQNLEGNPFFKSHPGEEGIVNGEEVGQTLKQGKNVVCYLNGHVHWLYYKKVDKIHCISIPSFLENHPLKSNSAGQYCEMTLDETCVELMFKTVNPPRVLGKIEFRVE